MKLSSVRRRPSVVGFTFGDIGLLVINLIYVYNNLLLSLQTTDRLRPVITRGVLDLTNIDSEIVKRTPLDSPASPVLLPDSQKIHFEGFSYVRPFSLDRSGVFQMSNSIDDQTELSKSGLVI